MFVSMLILITLSDVFFVLLQVFEYGTVIRDVVDIHCPVNEMVCNSKIR